MDIAALSINLATSKASESVGILVAKMAKEQMEQTGEQLAQIMEAPSIPIDCTIDISI